MTTTPREADGITWRVAEESQCSWLVTCAHEREPNCRMYWHFGLRLGGTHTRHTCGKEPSGMFTALYEQMHLLEDWFRQYRRGLDQSEGGVKA